MRVGWLTLLAWLALGCSTSEGTGYVKSSKLYVHDCWNGPYDLGPTFFGANPDRDAVLFRIQRGDDLEEVSDGLIALVNDVTDIRSSSLGDSLEVGLPVGVTPPGQPVVPNPHPPKVSLALYFHDTCHLANAALYSIAGTLRFDSLFSGDANERNADDRLTDATFRAQFADPRDRNVDGSYPSDRVSQVEGAFRFYFQRGQPAQPFP